MGRAKIAGFLGISPEDYPVPSAELPTRWIEITPLRLVL